MISTVVPTLTKSNAATFRFPIFAAGAAAAAYLPASKLSFTTLQIIFSGSFFDSGVKKFATALLVVVDCCLRFEGGGLTPLSFELGRFPRPGLSTISKGAGMYDIELAGWQY